MAGVFSSSNKKTTKKTGGVFANYKPPQPTQNIMDKVPTNAKDLISNAFELPKQPTVGVMDIINKQPTGNVNIYKEYEDAKPKPAPRVGGKKEAFMGGLFSGATLGLTKSPVFTSHINPQMARDFEATAKAHPIANTLGEFTGILMPGAAVDKALGATIKGATLLPKLARGAISGGSVMGVQSANEGNDLKQIGKDALAGATFGAGAEGLLYGGGKLYKAFKGAKTLPKVELPKRELPTLNIQSAKPTTLTSKLTKQIELPDNIMPSVGLPKANQLSDSLEPKFTQPKFKAPKFNNKNEEVGVRSFGKTVKEADLTTPEISNILQDEVYQTLRNKDVLEFAKKYVKDNPEKALRIVKSPQSATAESNAIAQELIRQAQNAGNYEHAIDLIETVSKKATESGQAVQALSMWGRLTPEGMLRHAQKTFDNANKLNPNLNIKLDNELANFITKSMQEINKMADGRAKQILTQKVLTTIDEKVPVGILKKISSVQTLSQLLNPKTFIRNIGGNLGFGGLENVKDVVKVPIDKATSLFTGKRTSALPSIKTQFQGFKKGLKLGLEDVKHGIDTSNVGTQFELNNRSIFNSKIMKTAEKALNYSLRVPDRAFYQSTFEESLRQQMKAAGVKEPTKAMEEIAHLDALYRTFQDENVASKAFQMLKRGLNLGKEFGFGDLVLKYPKTPANLLMRSIEYSPVGFFKSIAEMVRPLINKTAFNQKAFVEATSRALVGTTSLMGTGYILHKLDIITGKREKDTETANLLQNVGIGGYKFNTSALKRFVMSGFNPDSTKMQEGDTLVSYDWLQPMAVGVALGANISANQVKDANVENVSMIDSILTSIQEGTNTLAEQSLLRNLTDLFRGNKDLFTVVADTIESAPATFVPTFINQIRQITDNTRRDTYSKNFTQSVWWQTKNKIPLASKTLEPSISTLGKEQQIYQKPSLFNVFLNPAFVSKYSPTQEAKMVIDLFTQTGETKQMPRFVKDYFLADKQKIILTSQEKTKLQIEVGKKTEELLKNLSQNTMFRNQSPEKQIDTIYKKLDEAGEYGRNIIKRQRGLRIK